MVEYLAVTGGRTWGDLLQRVQSSIESGEWERGEEAVEWMRREAAHQGDLGQESSALFYEGMLADAKGELERAEVCFAEAVDIDRRHYGEKHTAVGDALSSLAKVRLDNGKPELAAVAYEQAAEVYAHEGAAIAAEMFTRAGNCRLVLSQWEQAEALFGEAVDAVSGPDTRWVRYASLGLYQAYVRREMLVEAFSACAWATQQPRPEGAIHDQLQARLWCSIGHLSFRFGLDAQCAFSYGCVFALTDDEALCAEAEGCLAELGRDAPELLDGYTVVHVDEARRMVHVAERDGGLWLVKDTTGFVVGEVVELDVSGDRPVLV